MYNDFHDTSRSRWRFTYTAQQLLRYAEKRLTALNKIEEVLRKKIAEAMGNKNISVTGDRVKKLETEISKVATQAEQFDVYVYEFKRVPDKEYQFSVSDVVFFGIIGTPADFNPDEMDW